MSKIDKPLESPRQLVQVVTNNGKLVKRLIAEWHSTLGAPIGWKVAFVLLDGNGVIMGVSTWGRPTARLEDQVSTLEHTRMALRDGAPKNSASYFLALNRKWIRENMTQVKRLIAYINLDHHKGVTYLADNWSVVYRKRTHHSWGNRPGRKANECKLRLKLERKP